MLESITLKNFKLFEEVSLDLGRITILIGPNGTGKSSILQALALLKQSAGQNQLVMDGPYVRLGGYADIVHAGSTEGLSFTLTGRTELRPPPSLTTPDLEALKEFAEILEVKVPPPPAHISPRPFSVIYEIQFGPDGYLASYQLIVRRGRKEFIRADERTTRPNRLEVPGSYIVLGPVEVDKRPVVGRPLGIQSSGYSTSDPEFQKLASFANELTKLVSDSLERAFFVWALRGFDKPIFTLRTEPFPHPMTAEETASTLAYDRELEEKISGLTEKLLNARVRARLVPRHQLTVEALRGGAAVNIVNEGFGLNQLVLPLLQLLQAPEGALVGIEEPEIHLHPRAQAKLADILLREVAIKEDKQLLITTHSEHILIGFLTAVAEGKLKPEDLAVYYFEPTDGTARAERLPVDEKGALKGGLKGFFEADMDELSRHLKALAQTKE